MTQQVIKPELNVGVHSLTHVAPAVVGPFGPLWERIERSVRAGAATAAFSAPRGFLPQEPVAR
jgi:hypothetical protein